MLPHEGIRLVLTGSRMDGVLTAQNNWSYVDANVHSDDENYLSQTLEDIDTLTDAECTKGVLMTIFKI